MAIDLTLDDVASGYDLSKINSNFTKIDTALQAAVSRSGTAPNQMQFDFDMNGNDLLNVGTIAATDFTIAGSGVTAAVQQAVDAAVNAAASALAAQAALADFQVGSLTNFISLGDGATAIYALDASAQSTNTIVVVGGVTQAPYDVTNAPDGFTLVDGVLTFSENVPTGAIVFAQTFDTIPIGQPSAALTSILDTAGYYTSANVEGALAEVGTLLAAPAIIDSPANPADYTGTDTSKVQQALDAGKAEIKIDGTYTIGQIVPAAGNKLVYGRGQLIQQTLGTDMVVATGLTDFTWSVDMLGIAPALTTPSSVDDALELTDCDDITIQDCKIENFRSRPIFAIGGDRWLVRNVKFNTNAVGPRFIDVHDLRILYNDVKDKCLATSQFTTGIGLESTDGYGGRPVCSDVLIMGNKTSGLGASQGILVHGGIRVTCTNNDVTDSTIGISFNPYNAADYILYPVISNNRIINNSTLTWDASWGGNSALVVQAGPGTPDISQPVISGNVILQGNRQKAAASEGGIQIGYAEDPNISGNIIRSSWACGMRVVDCVAANITGNQIDTVISAAGQQYGIYATGSNGLISGTFKSVGTTVDAAGMTVGDFVSI